MLIADFSPPLGTSAHGPRRGPDHIWALRSGHPHVKRSCLIPTQGPRQSWGSICNLVSGGVLEYHHRQWCLERQTKCSLRSTQIVGKGIVSGRIMTPKLVCWHPDPKTSERDSIWKWGLHRGD